MKSLATLLIAALPLHAGIPDSKARSAEDEALHREQQARDSELSRRMVEDRTRKAEQFLQRLRIRVKGDSCLAANFRTGACAVTVAQFHAGIETQLPHNLDTLPESGLAGAAAEVRKRVLDQRLEEAFLGETAASAAPPQASAGTDRSPAAPLPGGRMLRLMPFISRLFPELRAQAVAASDSAWLREESEAREKRILPVTLAAADLPDSLASELSGLGRGEWSGMRRTAFGYVFLARLDTLDLPALAERVAVLLEGFPAPSEADLRRAVQEHLLVREDACLRPDTLLLSLRLSPPARKQGPAREPAWVRATSLDLPPPLLAYLRRRKAGAGADTLGPVRDAYGVWRIAILGERPGAPKGDSACFADARADILAARKLDYLKAAHRAWAEKAKAPSGPVRARYVGSLQRSGFADAEAEFRKRRDDWIASSIRLNY